MPRSRFQALTEQMFYILLCLRFESCGMDIMDQVQDISGGRVSVGPGTVYNLLEQFLSAGMIKQTKAEGRRKSYILTDKGMAVLTQEYQRLSAQIRDYQDILGKERDQ